jgi:hypothetical protein
VKKMLAAGASGYVPKTVGRQALEGAIRTAAAGCRTLVNTSPPNWPGSTSGREEGIECWVSKGFTQRPQRENKIRRRVDTGLCTAETRTRAGVALRERAASRLPSWEGLGGGFTSVRQVTGGSSQERPVQ